MSNKTLVIIFSVLLVVLLGEVGYLFFYAPGLSSAKKNIGIPSCSPPAQLVKNPLIPNSSAEAIGLFVRQFDKNNGDKVTIKVVTEGRVSNIQKLNYENIEYTAFDLLNKDNDIIKNINLKESDSIYKMVDGVKTKVGIPNLEEGQKIETTLIYDLVDFDKRAYRELLIY